MGGRLKVEGNDGLQQFDLGGLISVGDWLHVLVGEDKMAAAGEDGASKSAKADLWLPPTKSAKSAAEWQQQLKTLQMKMRMHL